MTDTAQAPVIVKRKKKAAAEGHHGGAWKVAYADFVTAMMAFFMLMWLLNATTEKQRKGIADYFNPTIPVNRISGGGEDMFGGDNIFSDEVIARSGVGGTTDEDSESRSRARGQQDQEDPIAKLKATVGSQALSDAQRAVIGIRETDEGLVIDLFDPPEAPVFAAGGAQLTSLGREVMEVLADALGSVANDLAILGHVAPRPLVLREADPWARSSVRADVARRALVGAGLDHTRLRRVGGGGDASPFPDEAAPHKNTRVELILLRS